MSPRTRFAQHFAMHFLGAQVEKKLFGGRFIRLGRLLSVGGFLFETGAILGHAFRDRLDVFAVPFNAEPDRPEAVEFIRQQGRSLGELAADANTIYELVIMHEMRKDDSIRAPTAWAEWLMARGDEKLPVEFAMQMGMLYGVMGAGFGAESPERLEELYANSYGQQDPETWHSAHKHGLVDSPQPPQYVPFEDRRREAVAGFAEWCEEYYPEALVPLGLEAQETGRP